MMRVLPLAKKGYPETSGPFNRYGSIPRRLRRMTYTNKTSLIPRPLAAG